MNDLLLLSMMLDSPKYGYQLKREAGLIMGQALHNNLVYPSLRRFLEEGWVSKKAVPGERGQTRQQYVLSAEGRRHLFERLNEFSEDAPQEAAFHLRIGLFPALKRETRENILARREAWLQARDKNLATLQCKPTWSWESLVGKSSATCGNRSRWSSSGSAIFAGSRKQFKRMIGGHGETYSVRNGTQCEFVLSRRGRGAV
jgi:DNA-binding PadR family transcriptional regulator